MGQYSRNVTLSRQLGAKLRYLSVANVFECSPI